MVRHSPFTAVLACVLLVLAAQAQAQAGDDYQVVFSQVVHRHGSRNPDIYNSEREFLCGYEYPCGGLTGNGRLMMESFGDYLRARYNDATVVDTPFFPSTSYNISTIYSRSTAAPRNLQSAESVLIKLFPDTATFNPAIQTVNKSLDVLLNVETMPRAFTRITVDTQLQEDTLGPVVSKYFTYAQLHAMAQQAHVVSECSSSTHLYHCAWALHDVGMAFQAAGRLSEVPLLSDALPNLVAINTVAHRWVFGYDATSSTDKTQGTMAQPLAQELISNMRNYIAGKETSVRLRQYTVHDTEIEALLTVFGDQSDAAFTSVFGDSLQVELLKSKTDGSYAVQVLRSVPSSPVPASGSFTYTQQAPQIKCLGASSATAYDATNNICILDDFARYVDSTKGTSSNSWCELPSSEFESLDCLTTSGAPTNQYCALYRILCPATSCESGYVLNAADLSCVRLPSMSDCGSYKVIMSQVVHRHGARSPIITENTTEICGTEYPCGYLNEYGQEMMYAVGEYLRSRYNNVTIVDEPFFPFTKYNASLIYTRSTNLERTIQSAASVLAALFPSGKTFFPVIFSHNMTIDFLLNTDPMPPVLLKRHYDNDGLAELLNPVVDATITWEKLQIMADEGYYGGSCVDYAMRWQCAMDMYDIGTSFEAQHKLDDKPTLAAGIPALTRINGIYYEFVMKYNASVPLLREQGAMAQNLAQTLVSNIYAHLISPSYRMYEYSTHDSMVTPLGVTLGDQSFQTFTPQYGTTYIVELLERADSTKFVRILRGEPHYNETGDSYFFEETGFVQHCIDSQGQMYVAEDNICPLEDFVRMVDYSKPAVQDGYCVVNQTLYDRMKCPLTVDSPEWLSPDCELYRIACPSNSCPDGYILSAADYQCYGVSGGTTPPTSTTSTTTTTMQPETPPPLSSTTTTTTTTTSTFAPSPPSQQQSVPQAIAQRPKRVEQRRRVAQQLALGVTTGVVVGTAVKK